MEEEEEKEEEGEEGNVGGRRNHQPRSPFRAGFTKRTGLIFFTLYFEIVIDSQEVAQIIQGSSMYTSPSFPQW